MVKMRSILSWAPLALVLVLALGSVAAAIHGCRAIESAADSMADATSGSSVSNIFRGTARLAESYRDYSPSEQHFIGRAVAAEILTRFKVHDDPKLAEYVNLVGLSVAYSSADVLQTFSGYHFTVLESDEVNAISAPGGFIFLTLGTIRKAKDEDELAAVLAHEVAHVTLGHGINSISKATRKKSGALLLEGIGSTGAELAGSEGDAKLVELTGLFASAIQDIASELIVKGYSRESELEADALAVKFLGEAKYSRAALVAYLGHLGEAGGSGGWTATHPKPGDRIAELKKVAADEPSVLAGVPVREKRFRAVVKA